MHYTNGGLTYSDLLNLPFDRYEEYVKEAIRIQPKEEDGN